MKIGVFGTGMVGQAIASKLVELGHDVVMGSRTADNEKSTSWAAAHGDLANAGTYEAAAKHGELLFNCTSGMGSLAALEAAGTDNLAGKVLIDIANPLDFSNGFPPVLSPCNDDSLGEQIQAAYPDVRVVKTLNTVNCALMVSPGSLPEPTVVFVSGNDPDAKQQVSGILSEWFGWESIMDLGDITTARGTEMFLALWVRMYGALGTADFNFKLVR